MVCGTVPLELLSTRKSFSFLRLELLFFFCFYSVIQRLELVWINQHEWINNLFLIYNVVML